MNDRDAAMIPYFAHEGEMARMERMSRRLWIAVILLIVMLVGTNLAWVIYESQFQDVVIEQDADTGFGGNNYLNGTGDFSYGTGTPDYPDTGKP